MPGIPIWAYALVAALIFGAGATAGHKVTSNAWKAEQAEVIEKAVADYKAEAAKENVASAKTEDRKDEIRTVYQTVTKTVDRIVERPVYRNTCIDDDGLRAVNAALSGKAEPAGQSDARVPPAHAP